MHAKEEPMGATKTREAAEQLQIGRCLLSVQSVETSDAYETLALACMRSTACAYRPCWRAHPLRIPHHTASSRVFMRTRATVSPCVSTQQSAQSSRAVSAPPFFPLVSSTLTSSCKPKHVYWTKIGAQTLHGTAAMCRPGAKATPAN